jgi:hypothetical protein
MGVGRGVGGRGDRNLKISVKMFTEFSGHNKVYITIF